MPTNRQITLAARPEGFPKETDFALIEAPVAEPNAGEVLVRARWLSLDPYMRGRMSTTRAYATALAQSGSPLPRTHISGCERRCGAPTGDHQDLVAPDAVALLSMAGEVP